MKRKRKYFFFKKETYNGPWVPVDTPDTKDPPPLVTPSHISVQGEERAFTASAHEGIDAQDLIVEQPSPEDLSNNGPWVPVDTPDTKDSPPLVTPPHISVQTAGGGEIITWHEGIDAQGLIMPQPAPETDGFPKRKKKKNKT